jgi:hypothetical protein
MMTSAPKSERTRLDWSVQNDVDPISIPITPAAEATNHAQFARQMPEPRHSGPKKLDRGAKLQQHQDEGVLLGECRLIHGSFLPVAPHSPFESLFKEAMIGGNGKGVET